MFFSGRGTSFTDPDIELWTTDGTVAGTARVEDIEPGLQSSIPEYLTLYNKKVFFTCRGSLGLWSSDGTAAGTVEIKTLPFTAQSLRVFNGKLYFLVNSPTSFGYKTVWESDGTTAGTKQIYSSSGDVSDYNITPSGLYIFEYTGNKNLIKRFDFTTKTATTVYDGAKGYATPMVSVKGKDYFIASDNFIQTLYVTDGKASGTKEIITIKASDGVYPYGPIIIAAESYLVFSARDLTNGTELWISDGTTVGTKPIDLYKGKDGSSPGDFCKVGNSIYFSASATDATGKELGRELFQTDGTVAGTKLTADIFPGANSSTPERLQLVTLGGKPNLIFFAASDKGAGPFKIEVKIISDTKDNTLNINTLGIYPNPATQEINIRSTSQENIDITLFDINGRQIKQLNNSPTNSSIDISTLPKGVYLLKAQYKNGQQQLSKFVKN